jgi:hypothetical protein
VNDGMMVFAILANAMFIVGGVILIGMAMYQRTKKLEMQHRERLAMIERGLAPSPETNPGEFGASAYRPGTSRYTSLGIAVVGVGLGLMLLIGVAGGAPDAGVGVGGAIVVLGAAFIVNGYLQRGMTPLAAPQHPPPAAGAMPQPPRPGPTDPPGPIAP